MIIMIGGIFIKNKRITIIILLLVIGFAAVTTSLYLNGKASVSVLENDYDVYFSSSYLNDEIHNEFISTDGKTISFKTDKLTNVGEQAILKYEITNASNQYSSNINLELHIPENDYIKVENRFNVANNEILPKECAEGKLIITMIKSYTGDDDFIEIIVDLNAKIVEIDENGNSSSNLVNTKKSISGHLTDEFNNPIAGKIIALDTEPIKYAVTNESGYFEITDLDDGDYNIYYLDKTEEDMQDITKETIEEVFEKKTTISIPSANKITFDGQAKVEDLQITEESKNKYPASDTHSKIIAGFLTDKDGNPLVDKIIAISTEPIKWVKTDESGYFELTDIEQGSYELYYLDNETEEDMQDITKEKIESIYEKKTNITTSSPIIEFDSDTKVKHLVTGESNENKHINIKIGDITKDYVISKDNTIDIIVDSPDNKIIINGKEIEVPFETSTHEILTESGEKIIINVTNIRPHAYNVEYLNPDYPKIKTVEDALNDLYTRM